MKRRHDAILVVLLSIAALSVGCTDNPVGRICDLGTATPQANQVIVASPSLDCVSRTCLRVPPSRTLPTGSVPPGDNSGLCTAECSADADCDRVPESPCVTGFTCGVAVTAGPFCCKKFCICKDYIVLLQPARPRRLQRDRVGRAADRGALNPLRRSWEHLAKPPEDV